mgnify:FL=1
MTTLIDQIQTVAKSRASATAMSTGSDSISFEEMINRRDAIVSILGDKFPSHAIAIVAIKNRTELSTIILALWKLGVSVALASPKYSQSETSAILAGLSPDIVISDSPESFGNRSSGYTFTADTIVPGISIGYPSQHRNRQTDGAEWYPIIKLTSGSTGIPKAVALTESNLLAEAETIQKTLEVTESDTILAPVPLIHSYGFDLGMLMMFLTGAKLEAPEGFIPRSVARAMESATIFLGVPTMYQAILETRFSQQPDFAKPRFLLSCTAPLSSATIRAFHERFGAIICQHYGSSEAGATTLHMPSEVMEHPDSVGKAMTGVELTLLDSEGKVGDEGEIIVASKGVASAYLMGGPNDKNPLGAGRYYTGDIGYRDSGGRIFVTGRIDQLINVGGLKVSPQEVVAVLETCPEVKEAAVKGVADSSGSMVVCAFVVVNSASSESSIIDYCRTRLAEYKVPRRVHFLDQLPRTANGKVMVSGLDLPYITE